MLEWHTGEGVATEGRTRADEDSEEEGDDPREAVEFSTQLTEVQQQYKGQLAKKLQEV